MQVDQVHTEILDTTLGREEGVSLDPMGEQSGMSQISHNSSLSLESGEGEIGRAHV